MVPFISQRGLSPQWQRPRCERTHPEPATYTAEPLSGFHPRRPRLTWRLERRGILPDVSPRVAGHADQPVLAEGTIVPGLAEEGTLLGVGVRIGWDPVSADRTPRGVAAENVWALPHSLPFRIARCDVVGIRATTPRTCDVAIAARSPIVKGEPGRPDADAPAALPTFPAEELRPDADPEGYCSAGQPSGRGLAPDLWPTGVGAEYVAGAGPVARGGIPLANKLLPLGSRSNIGQCDVWHTGWRGQLGPGGAGQWLCAPLCYLGFHHQPGSTCPTRYGPTRTAVCCKHEHSTDDGAEHRLPPQHRRSLPPGSRRRPGRVHRGQGRPPVGQPACPAGGNV